MGSVETRIGVVPSSRSFSYISMCVLDSILSCSKDVRVVGGE